MNQWKETTWGDLATLEYGKALRDYRKSSGCFRVYGTNGPIGWHTQALYDKPSVIIGRKGAYRGVYYAAEPFFVIDTAFYLKPKIGFDMRWAYYELLTHDINSMDSGSAIPSTSRDAFYYLPVCVPPLEVQHAIAKILSELDDKIELNRQMNETLEEMARALFKSWFVDFDPVRAKIDGRWRKGESLPGLPAHLYDLFPDRLVDSELGEIPEGWEVTTIGAIAEVIDCLHSRKPKRRDTGLPLMQLANIRDDGLLDMTDIYLIDEADYRQWITRMEASAGDCVITNVGRVGAVSQVPAGQRAALGRNMTGVRCRRDVPYPTVLIECLLSHAMKDEIALKMDTGTILDALNVRNIPRLRFVRGKHEVLAFFERSCRSLRAKMEGLLVESRTLAALRDTLLPKLISGELRVKDAEKFIGRAAV